MHRQFYFKSVMFNHCIMGMYNHMPATRFSCNFCILKPDCITDINMNNISFFLIKAFL